MRGEPGIAGTNRDYGWMKAVRRIHKVEDRRVAGYGAWRSPITSDLIVSKTIGLGEIVIDDKNVFWLEGRPAEAGRNVIVQMASTGEKMDVTPAPFNVRTRVHEYGGGAYIVANRVAYFSHFIDNQLYRQPLGKDPVPVTDAPRMRYADFVFDSRRNVLFSVREDHSNKNTQAVNTIVRISLANGGSGDVVVSGNDFYSSPRLNRDGTKLAWLTWNHPNMPWDGTELWVASVTESGDLEQAHKVAGSPSESIFQPEWSPNGDLYFVSDKTNWWNLYRWQEGKVESMLPMEAEFGLPQWVFRQSTYAFLDDERLVCAYVHSGVWKLGELNPRTKHFREISLPYTTITGLTAGNGKAYFRAGAATQATSVVELTPETGKTAVLQQSNALRVDEGYLSNPHFIEFPTENNQSAYGIFYAPRNKDFAGPKDERPPLLVLIHGGPTSAAAAQLNLSIQFWTSRGIAVLDVNYGGSTGYGRAYRDRLKGQWGIVDVDDCANGALYLGREGLVDVNRMAIAGGSAGGYTTLAALTFRNVFRAGASYYGVSDIELLAKDTHKFESRYMESLVGDYPKERERFHKRSPLYAVEQLDCPVIFFQGLDDKIVPPNQAEKMVDALRQKGVPVAYLTFEGEGHGFRKSDNIKQSLDAELYFFSKVFGFALADQPAPIMIENL